MFVTLDDVTSLSAAMIDREATGAIVVRTPPKNWAYALLIPLAVPADAIGVQVAIDLEVLVGTIGIFITDQAAQVPLGREQQIGAGARTTVILDAGAASRKLCLRTADHGAARVRIVSIRVTPRRSVDITAILDTVLPAMLREPGPPALVAIARALSTTSRPVDVAEIGALRSTRAPVPVPYERVFADPLGQLILEDVQTLVELLPTYDPGGVDRRTGFLGRDYFQTYFHQSAIRVYHLVQLFRELGFQSGRILELGSLAGQFALTLVRLGYDVTVVDRYRVYHGAFDGYIARLRDAGVHVVETDRDDEARRVGSLGEFDAVMAMAVVEHIPHTPREFLRMMTAHLRPGGVLALDTPNLARERNRELLMNGQSIHQAIDQQFHGEIPWEGHHREYTAAEMAWMLRAVGCADVQTRLFDYNLLQFRELSSEHLNALLAMTVDPTRADMVLAAGRFTRPTAEPSRS